MIVEENGRYRVVPNECKEHDWQYSHDGSERQCHKCRRREMLFSWGEWVDVTGIGDASLPPGIGHLEAMPGEREE